MPCEFVELEHLTGKLSFVLICSILLREMWTIATHFTDLQAIDASSSRHQLWSKVSKTYSGDTYSRFWSLWTCFHLSKTHTLTHLWFHFFVFLNSLLASKKPIDMRTLINHLVWSSQCIFVLKNHALCFKKLPFGHTNSN